MAYPPSAIVAIAVLFSILPIAAVGARFWARQIKHMGFGPDDFFIIPALICTLFVNITLIVSVYKGEHGYHQNLGPQGQLIHDSLLITYEKCRLIMEAVSFPAMGFSKLSVLFLFKRIFTVKPFRIAAWIMIILTAGWTVAFFFAIIFQCTPVSAFWEQFDFQHAKYCLPTVPFYEATTYTDIFFDVLILAMPIPMVWRLHLPLNQKIAVMFTFLLGGFVLFAGVTRLVYFFQLAPELKAHFNDVTYFTPPIFVWCAIENGSAVVSACLPTLRPLIKGEKSVFSLVRMTGASSILSIVRSKPSSARVGDSSSYNRQTSTDGDGIPLSGNGSSKNLKIAVRSSIEQEYA